MRIYSFVVLVLIVVFAALSCGDEVGGIDDPPVPTPVQVKLFDLPEEPFDVLSAYGFFIGAMSDLQPHPTLIPYGLPTELFSNYSTKQRFVYLPPGKKATYRDEDQRTLIFPDSTVIIKTFFYYDDFRNPDLGKNIIETRLLIRQAGEWVQAEYIWNEDQTDAALHISGRQKEVSWIHFDGQERTTLYAIPNHNECKGCHELGEDLVLIGPKARYLNSDFDYGEGPENQLLHWSNIDRLEGMPSSTIPQAATFEDARFSLEEQARTYLDINCAHCHNGAGPANNSALFLEYNQTDPFALGFCKPPVAAGGGSGGLKYAIVPGQPDESIMIYRLNSLEIKVSMPELGRSVVHEEGMTLLREWIASMPEECD